MHLSIKRFGLHNNQQEVNLIEKALNGDQTSFKELYDLHVDGLYCFLAQFSESTSQREEWTQRAFIKAFNKLEQFKSNSSFKTWLFTIGLNEMRTDMRTKIHFEKIEDHHIENEKEDSITETKVWQHAKKAIRQLDPEKRIICLLHIAENYNHAEIANILGITEGSSRIILHRAKKELQTLVDK